MLLIAQAVAKEWLFPLEGKTAIVAVGYSIYNGLYFNFFQLFTHNDLPSRRTASLIHPVCYLQRNHKDLH